MLSWTFPYVIVYLSSWKTVSLVSIFLLRLAIKLIDYNQSCEVVGEGCKFAISVRRSRKIVFSSRNWTYFDELNIEKNSLSTKHESGFKQLLRRQLECRHVNFYKIGSCGFRSLLITKISTMLNWGSTDRYSGKYQLCLLTLKLVI